MLNSYHVALVDEYVIDGTTQENIIVVTIRSDRKSNESNN